jgi:hypothetical protein
MCKSHERRDLVVADYKPEFTARLLQSRNLLSYKNYSCLRTERNNPGDVRGG